MIAFVNFFARKPNTPRQLRLPRPATFILIRGADEERIDAEYDETGTVMRRLVVFSKSPPLNKRVPIPKRVIIPRRKHF
jgi:hypothetical protein